MRSCGTDLATVGNYKEDRMALGHYRSEEYMDSFTKHHLNPKINLETSIQLEAD